MNPFGQIIDLTSINGIESGKTGPGSLNNGDPKGLGIDFLQILGGKLSGELPLLFGEGAESVGAETIVSDEILSDKLAESLLSDFPNKLTDVESKEFANQNNLIDPKKISSEQFLKIKTAEAISNTEKLLNIEAILPSEPNIKAENLNINANQSILSSELKIDNLNLNSNLVLAQIDSNNPEVEIRSSVLVETDKELLPKNNVDLKTAGLIEKVAGSLNIKNVKLEKNSENNQIDKEPIKLVLPTKSYIKVTAIDGNSDTNSNNKQFAETRQSLFSGKPEITPPENVISDGEKIKLNNFEAVARIELDQISSSKIETGQPTIQTKLISDIAPTLANNIEKVELPEIKVAVASVKFVLPTEINGKNIKNNHTVMIRMEPDHLGPVRMTVSTYNDVMTARLVVESPIAKAVVESNLNNLVEQLNKQGIKVDLLDVSVSGGEVGHEAKENRFAGSAGTARQNLKNYENSTAINDVMAQRAREHLYIETSGVNCFA